MQCLLGSCTHVHLNSVINEWWIDSICQTPTLLRTFFCSQVIAELKKKKKRIEHSLFFVIE